MITKLTVTALVSFGLLLSACNTIGGAGEDIESVGDTIEDAAE